MNHKNGFVKKLILLVKVTVVNFIEYYYSLRYYHVFKIPLVNHLTIGVKNLGKKKTFLPHPIGIVIGKNVLLGDNCTIYQNVTIGVSNNKIEEYPTIGHNVIIYAGAIIIGNVHVGNNAVIGAGCLVTKDVPENKIAVGSPMRILDKKESTFY
jgi:serine O-acetyltransferase